MNNRPGIPEVGTRFSRWTLLERVMIGQRTHWVCRCDCGVQRTVAQGNLKSGASKSCGCLQRELNSTRSATHGLSNTRTYRIWKGIIKRCENPSASGYYKYGGRGIRVCDRWRTDYLHFLHDMGECPEGRSIDRVDCNGNYEPSNCRWATPKTQANNTRRNVLFEGKSIAEWAAITGMKAGTLKSRLRKRGTIYSHDPRAIPFPKSGERREG